MTEKNIETKSSKSYLILSIGVLITGMILFYYYSDVRLFYRVVGMISVVIFSAFIAYQSDFGKLVYSYVTDSKVELKKVTWPTKQETTQTTLGVIFVVIIVGILLWLFDMLLGLGYRHPIWSCIMDWYVLQAFSGYENKVKLTLEDRIKRSGLQDSFEEILVPTEEVLEIKEGKKKRSERKYFPGYVMIKMDMNDETWHLVKSAPQVLGFIGGTSDKPVPLKKSEADSLMQSMQNDVDKPKPKVMFEPGEVVRITDGPFNDFNGVVETVDFEKNKLKVSVLVFGKPTPIELSLTQVEKG